MPYQNNVINKESSSFTVVDGNLTVTTALAGGGLEVWSTSASSSTPGVLFFNKSRNGGVITSGDELGTIEWQGYDGAAFQAASKILVTSTGVIGVGKIPSNLGIWTKPDSANPIAERMTIGSEGNVVINAADSGTSLAVTGTITATTTITATQDVTGRSLFATGDEGTGVVSQTALTNVNDVTANGAGTYTIYSKNANSADSVGFIKIWVGTTAYYVPFFATPNP